MENTMMFDSYRTQSKKGRYHSKIGAGHIFYILFLIFTISLSGCQSGMVGGRGDRELLSVDFKQGHVLRYKQVSEREVSLDFDPGGKISKGSDKGRVQTTTERLEIVVAYKPVKVDSRGFSAIEATFEQVKPSRLSLSGQQPTSKDALNYLQGKTVTFTISPSGIVTDHSGLNEMITKLGEEAFGGKGKGIKDPDMIQDFMTLEWMMWDAISSIKRPAQGVAAGETWQSQLMSPMPMPMRIGRDTTYKLDRIQEANGIRIADINSTYTLAEKTPPITVWPMPYTGSFQMRGVFGFLGGYKVLSLTGSGNERFNITAGRVEQIEQQYQTNVAAEMPFGLGSGSDTTPIPNMVVRQKLSAKLLNE
jgi:hypothetical protein